MDTELLSPSMNYEIEDALDADSDITDTRFNLLKPTVQTVGLDPLFRICMKLVVRDIFLLKSIADTEWKGTSDIFSFGNHIVNKVEIMGIIVRVDKREKHNTYAVDDGTGVINCTCWKNSRITSCPQEFHRHLPLFLQTKLSELVAYNKSNLFEGYELGDLVLISGRVTEFRDCREISVMTHRRIDNPNAEVERMSKLISFYEVYEQPFTLGPNLQRQLEKNSMGDSLFETLKNVILEILNRPGCELQEIIPKDMLTWPAIADLIQKHHSMEDPFKTLQSVLIHLESTQGCVHARRGQGHIFEVIWSGSRLANKVMKIINEACRSGKNADMGCHRLHIEDMLRKSPEYCSVPASVLTHLLAALETSSRVIMTEPQRYMGVSE